MFVVCCMLHTCVGQKLDKDGLNSSGSDFSQSRTQFILSPTKSDLRVSESDKGQTKIIDGLTKVG